jgi:serine/threonine protein kinase
MMPPDSPPAAPQSPGALPIGTRLGEFELRGVIGVGGFGIVYLAFDHALEREVAIKEFMPASLAGRSGSAMVSPFSQSHAESFALGLRSFVNEGRMLARFDSPSLLKVHRYWEANGTAYIAMPLYRGRTLREVRLAMNDAPDEAAARALLMPLLAAVDLLHRASVYHRDIAPDNILIEAGNRPVLLDFGAARHVLNDKSQSLTAVLKPAYAPIEQYAEAGSVKQGPWTDLYALGATLHFMLLGRAPPPSTTRAVHDDMQPLAERALPGCSVAFLQAIDWMLAPRPSDRPQSVAALVEVLEGRETVPVRPASPRAASLPAASPEAWDATRVVPQSEAPALSTAPASAAGDGEALPAAQRSIDLFSTTAPAAASVAPSDPPPVMPGASGASGASAPAVLSGDTAGAAGLARYGLPAVLALLLAVAGTWWFWPRAQPVPGTPQPLPAVSQVSSVRSAASTAASGLGKSAPEATEAGASAPMARAGDRASSNAQARPASRPAAGSMVEHPKAGAASSRPNAAAAADVQSAKGPREQCGKRVFVAWLNCMNRECAKPGNISLPECALYRPPS